MVFAPLRNAVNKSVINHSVSTNDVKYTLWDLLLFDLCLYKENVEPSRAKRAQWHFTTSKKESIKSITPTDRDSLSISSYMELCLGACNALRYFIKNTHYFILLKQAQV